MRTCRTASIVAFAGLFGAGVIGACRESQAPDVPEVTSARPTALPPPTTSAAPPVVDAAAVVDASSLSNITLPPEEKPAKAPVVTFIEGTKKLEAPICSRQIVVAARGTVKVGEETLAAGDVHYGMYPGALEVKAPAPSLAVHILQEFECAILSRPAATKTIIRAKDVSELKWGNGTMKAQLMVSSSLSPDLYVGRLEGTAAVAEHDHPTSAEILIAIEASGTFTIDGKEGRLGAKQIVTVPKGTKHAWKPDPGSKLVAIQIYDPPGPEQRFIALASGLAPAAGGVDAGANQNCNPPYTVDAASGRKKYKLDCLR